MKTKIIGISMLLLVLSSAALVAQGENDESLQRSNNRGEMHQQGNKRGQGPQGSNNSRGQGTTGEITSIDVNAKTFDIKGKNNLAVSFSIDDDTIIVSQDDFKNLMDNQELGRNNNLRNSIDTEGMSSTEKRQAMVDTREEVMAKIEQELKNISLDFSSLKESDNVMVHVSQEENDNTVRLIVIQ